MKKVLFLLIIVTIGAACYIYKDYFTAPVRVMPLTYRIEKSLFNVKEVENSNILFIGDQMGAKLIEFVPELIKDLSQNLESPLKVSNLTTANEGLHRTLFKLKQIQDLPEIVIYHAGMSEFYERKFNVSQYSRILKNFETYNDEKKISLIMTFPWLSKVLYRPTAFYQLDSNIKENKSLYPAKYKMQQMELAFKFYNIELEEIIKYVTEQNKTLVLITTPINLLLPPKLVCENTTRPSIDEDLLNFEESVKKGKSKLIIDELEKYAHATVGNARAYHILGIANITLGRYSKAKEYLKKAAQFDCDSWRPSNVINSILKTKASNHHLFLIDFAKNVNNNLGKNDLFLHENYPHNIYYNDTMSEVKNIVRKVLKL